MVLQRPTNTELEQIQQRKFNVFISPFIILITLVIIAVIYYANHRMNEQKISEVKISDAYITEISTLKVIIENFSLNKSKKDINLQSLADTLLQIPYIHRVFPSINHDGQLIVEVEEKHIIARLISESSHKYYISDDGAILPYKQISFKHHIPTIYGLNSEKDKNRIEEALKLIKLISEYRDASLLPYIAIINFREKDNIEFIINNNSRIILGKLDNIMDKIDKLFAYIQLKNQNRKYFSKVLDLRWRDIIVES